MPTVLSPERIANEQCNDAELQDIIQHYTSLLLQEIEVENGIEIYCNISAG